jgi:hypothetical protein
MRRMSSAALLALVVSVAPSGAQSPDERAAARDVVTKSGDALVTVMGTLKLRMTRGGQDNPAPDQAVRAPATVIDPSGLTVVALSAIDPGSMMNKTVAFAQTNSKMTTELVDVKIRLADGKELPARVVLRDSDLDLLFVKPATAPEAPMAALASVAGVLATLDAVVVVQRGGELTAWKPVAALGSVQAVVDKPRTFYMIGTAMTGSAVGATVFDMKGQFAGMVTLRMTEDSKNNALNGLQGTGLETFGLIPIVVPASDIREVAKQAK